jgi:hypothetical protein
MTPKEKADDLINKYLTSRDDNQWDDVRDVHAAIRCALIAVDEVLNTIMSVYQPETKLFWLEVKQEIEKL